MTEPDPQLPADPVARLHDLVDALFAERRWFEDTSALRYAAASLVTLPGEPARVAADLRAVAERLEQRARWFQPMKGPVRFIVAAMLLHAGLDGDRWCDEAERIEGLFADRKLKHGTIYTALSALLLHVDARARGRAVDDALVKRYGELHREMRGHHAFLTGQDDLPACALLVGQDGTPQAIAARCERFYEGLRDLGFRRGNALQGVSHVLVLAPDDDARLMQRFRALYQRFDDAGLWMHTGDYDDVAVLAFADHPAEHVVSTVLAHRDRLREHAPKPGRELAFSLACGTTFLELAARGGAGGLQGVRDAQAIRSILQMQQAAMIAACSGAAAAAAASGS